jgi:ferredoxin-NADP reductase
MKQYTLSNKQQLSDDVSLFTFQPNSQQDVVRHVAGQYISVGFKRHGRRTPMRSFSLVSSPTEADYVQVAMRIRGRFTSAADEQEIGDAVYIQGPFGGFTISAKYDRKIVMMAAGIGITPFMSMLRWAADTQLQLPIRLLYTCRNPSDIAFYDELLDLQERNPQLQVAFFLTGADTGQALKNSVQSRITESHVHQLIKADMTDATYFVCGPHGFMQQQELNLLNNGISADRIVTESFAQSSKLFSLDHRFSAAKMTYVFSGLLLLVGIASISAIDLFSSVPKLVSKQTTSATTTNTGNTTAGSSSTNTNSTADNTTSTATTTPTTSSTSSSGASSQNSSYSEPTSSVS